MTNREPATDEVKHTPEGGKRRKCPECRNFTLIKIRDLRYNKGFRWECTNCDKA